jgi:hypothetical protein
MSHDTHSHGGYEKKDVNVPMMMWISAAVVVVIVISVVYVRQYVTMEAEQAAYEIRLKPDNPQLLDLHAHEQSELAATRILDTAKGIYQIPIERAIELTLEQYKLDQKTPASTGSATR